MELSYAAVCFDLFGTLVHEDGRPIEGAREALAAVAGDRCAIVTSCGLAFARTLLHSAQLPEPQIIVTSDDVERGKPAPDGYLLAARRLAREPNSIVVLEDSRQGIAAARAAGMDVIGILAGRSFSYANEALYAVKRLSAIEWSSREDGTICLRF